MTTVATSILRRLSVLLFIRTLMIPMVCALSSAEDCLKILSSLAEEEEGETKDAKEDVEVKIASALEDDQKENELWGFHSSFGYLKFKSTPYFKIVIPPPQLS